MTIPQWHFREFGPGDNLSDPDFTKALFSSDTGSSAARSLIRESLQNSLDARSSTSQQVTVRIVLDRRNEGLPQVAATAPFLRGLADHLTARNTGLASPPDPDDPMPFLVIEDFGTRGLRGDPEHWRPIDLAGNGFFLFFRALGRSGKENEARGRWGVGKFVLPMSSKAHAIWGLTVSEDDSVPLLMGRAVLRTHDCHGASWHPDGHWGERKDPGSNLTSPVKDPAVIARFVSTFGLHRTSEPGLSVVIPWVIEDITAEAIQEAVIAEYFLPLLRGELVVELTADGVEGRIDGAAVRAYAKSTTERGLRELLALAVSVVDGATFALDWPEILPYGKLDLQHEQLPVALRDTLASAIEDGKTLSVRVPVTVGQKAAKQPPSGALTIHLRRSDGVGAVRPLIIRDGITISRDKTRIVHDHVALLVAERCALATALGDAETPAHTELQHELIKDRYTYAKKLVTFVRDSAANLLKVIRQGETTDDPFSLAGFFPVEAERGKPMPKVVAAPKGREPGPGLPPIPPARKRRYRVTRVDGGFSVSGNPSGAAIPGEMTVKAAYDVRRGDPFKRYRPFDFDFGKKAIRIDSHACEVVSSEEGSIVIRPAGADFRLTVTGFDAARDVIVRVLTDDGVDEEDE